MEELDQSKPYIVMEGFSDNEFYGETSVPLPRGKRIFFYAGNLKENSGVLDFAKAFQKIKYIQQSTENWGNPFQKTVVSVHIALHIMHHSFICM